MFLNLDKFTRSITMIIITKQKVIFDVLAANLEIYEYTELYCLKTSDDHHCLLVCLANILTRMEHNTRSICSILHPLFQIHPT